MGSDLRVVGNSLVRLSMQMKDSDEADLHGRSAYNRYYYASFLLVRSVLRELDSKWEKPNHSDIPDQLKGAVLDRLKSKLRELKASKLINGSDADATVIMVRKAIMELAGMLEKAKGIRRIADYEPGVAVIVDNGSFRLGGVDIEVARTWPAQAEALAEKIISAYRKAGLV